MRVLPTELNRPPLQPERTFPKPKIAVLIPCYNEERTVANVVRQFRAQLPDAAVYVFDNNSTDRTAEEASQAGAIVVRERRQGKGYVVQSMFRLDADVYVMVDGDGTYPAASVHQLIAPILIGEADMTVGSRLHRQSRSEFKRLNRAGNRLFLLVLNSLFHAKFTDLLSGYRAFSQEFVKDIPVFAQGFEIEAELTIKALQRGYRIAEVPIDLTQRCAGSHSKLRWVQDGMLIFNTMFAIFRDYKPLTFFGATGLAFIAAGLIPGLVVVFEFLQTGLVKRLPSAVLSVGLVLTGLTLIIGGLIVHTIVRRFQELDYQLRLLRTQLRPRHSVPTYSPFDGAPNEDP